jgi:hypothetical protein
MGAQDGSGKSVYISADYLGATKQVPYLLKPLVELLPALAIKIGTRDFHGNCDSNGILRTDLEQFDPSLLSKIAFGERDTYMGDWDHDLEVRFAQKSRGRDTVYCASPATLDLFIDPLKFEQRPLPTADAQAAFRARYALGDRKVIIGGSLAEQEIKPFCEAVRHARKKTGDDLCGLIVLRTEPENRFSLLPAQYGALTHHATHSSTPEFTVVTEAGVLQDLYAICDAAVIGNTLWNTRYGGGQNPIEPAFHGKHIISGPNWENNAIAFNGLAESGLLTIVESQKQLNAVVAARPKDLPSRQERAAAFLRSQQGAGARYAARIKEALYPPKGRRSGMARYFETFLG